MGTSNHNFEIPQKYLESSRSQSTKIRFLSPEIEMTLADFDLFLSHAKILCQHAKQLGDIFEFFGDGLNSCKGLFELKFCYKKWSFELDLNCI